MTGLTFRAGLDALGKGWYARSTSRKATQQEQTRNMDATATSPISPHSPVGPVYRPLPWFAWVVVGAVVLFGWGRANRAWSDVKHWYAGVQFCHASQWEGIYDHSINPLAIHSYYPVSLFVLLYPLGYLPPLLFCGVLTLGIVATWWLMFRFMQAGLPGDQRVGLLGHVPTAGAGIILGMLLGERFLFNDLTNQQINMLTFMPACVGLALMLPGGGQIRLLAGAALVAIGIGGKLFAVVLLAYLWCKRAWFAASLTTVCALMLCWGIPYFLLGADTFANLQALKQNTRWGKGMWLMEEDVHLFWSFANFVYYRLYNVPYWPDLAHTPPRLYQLFMVACTLAVGLPVFWIFQRKSWQHMDHTTLWEEIALVGVSWAIIDPVGQTAHFVTVVPALGFIVARRLADWHEYRLAPRWWETLLFLVIAVCNLFLWVRFPSWGHHHWYMYSGLYSLGQFALYGMTLWEVQRRSIRQNIAGKTGNTTDSTLSSASTTDPLAA